MVNFKKTVLKLHDKTKQKTSLLMMTRHETIQFDYPSVLYGLNFRPPCFNSTQKSLKIIIPTTYNVDRIFVFGSESIGILFIDKDIDIYLTQPVYEQILANYYSLLELRVTYDDFQVSKKEDKNEKIVDIGTANFKQLKKNVRFITYNEVIILNELSIKCISSGVHVGWCAFICSFEKTSMHISNKITKSRKFGIHYHSTKTDFVININDEQVEKNSIDDFNTKIVNSKSLILACDVPTTGVDLLFHLPFIFRKYSYNAPINVYFNNFKEYINNLSNHTDWLAHPINVQNVFDTVKFIDDIRCVKEPSIIIMDKAHLYGMNFKNMNILTVGEKILKPKLDDLTGNIFHAFYDSSFLEDYIIPTDRLAMKYDEIYSIDLDSKNTTINLINTTTSINDNSIYFYGSILNSDKFYSDKINITFEIATVELLNYLFNQEEYFKHDKHYFFPKYRIKIFKTSEGSYRIIRC